MFSRLSRKRVIVLLVLTCLLFITLDHRGNAAIDKARSVFADVLVPFDRAAEAVSKPIARAWNGITNYDDLERENEELRDQLDHQRGQQAYYQQAIIENRQLKELMNLPALQDSDNVFGRVVGEAPSNVQNTVEITVGRNDGVRVGMAVVNSSGLIGKIVAVYAESSVVMLISDPQYAEPGQVYASGAVEDDPASSTTVAGEGEGEGEGEGQGEGDGSSTSSSTSTTTTSTTTTLPRTPDEGGQESPGTTTTSAVTTTTIDRGPVRETGTVVGQGLGKPLLLQFIVGGSSSSGASVGDLVSTAGGDAGLAPEGIPIGVITATRQDSGSRTPIVEITPYADLRQLTFVAVVLYVPHSTSG